MFKIEDAELCADHAREWLKVEEKLNITWGESADHEATFVDWFSKQQKHPAEGEPSVQIEVTLNEKRDTMLLIFDQPMQYAGLGRQEAMALAGHMMNLAGKMK